MVRMKAPACVRCKWGTGTTCERAPDTVAAKEVKSQFEKMMAERAKQDAQWFPTKDDQITHVSSHLNDPGKTKK
jgi:hypothetical protein